MESSKFPAAALLLVVPLLLAPSSAVPGAADPIQIVSGTFVINAFDFNRGTFALVGADGSSLTGRWPNGGVQAAGACSGCAGGTAVSPAASFTFDVPFIGGDPFASGTAVLGGQTYSGFFGGDLRFTGPSTTLPVGTQAVTDTTLFSVTLPFTFTGLVNGYDLFGFREAQLRFTQAFTGQGQATVDFLAGGAAGTPTGYIYYRTTYEFQGAPIPEPATLMLVGSGIVALAGAARRKRR